MTRTLAALCLLVGLAAAVEAGEIRDYQVTVRTDPAGAGDVVLRATLQDPATVVRIPVGFAGILNVRLAEGPPGATVESEDVASHSLLIVRLANAVKGEVPLTVTFQVESVVPAPIVRAGERLTLPEGTRMLRHSLTNTQSDVLARYSIHVLLPAGMRVHAIREALPKLRGAEAGPRVRLQTVEGMPAVTLDVPGLRQGETASMLVELTQERRSWIWLVAGALLAVAYLFSFRDLV